MSEAAIPAETLEAPTPASLPVESGSNYEEDISLDKSADASRL